MKSPKKLIIALCAFSYCAIANAIDLEKTLYIAIQHFPPYALCEGKKAQTSFIKEVIDQACAVSNMSCLVECFPNRRSKAMMKSGEAHGNYPLGWNTDREKWLLWSPKLNSTEYGFFQHSHSDYKKIEDFSDKSIGALKPSNIHNSLVRIQASLLAEKGSTFIIAPQSSATGISMGKLSAKRIDGVYINRASGQEQINALGIDNVEYAFPVKKLNFYIGYSKEKNTGKRKELIDQFNRNLQTIKSDGIIKIIIDKYNLTYAIDDIQ